MLWRTTTDVEVYAAHVTRFLERDPCSRNVLRWIIELARTGTGNWSAPPWFSWLEDQRGNVVAAADWTPPYNALVSAMPAGAAPELVRELASFSATAADAVRGVSGPEQAATAFADAWTAATSASWTVHMVQTLYQLTAVRTVSAPSGSRRPAVDADIPLLLQWLRAFAEEVHMPIGGDPDATVRSLTRDGLLHVWVDGDEVVSMAGRRTPVAGAVRIGPVYTPPGRRARGYARRLVAELSEEALSSPQARFCMLFADAANPVSNAIYKQIGYTPREAHLDVAFIATRADR